jgi:hypothetical protein
VPIRDQAAQERSLDNDYGSTRGPSAPDSFEVALFFGDPRFGGVEVPTTTEVDDGAGGVEVVSTGYARAALSNDGWLAAEGGVKHTASPVAFPATAAEWPGTVTHWGLYDPVGGAWWDCAPLAEPLDITSAGAPPAVSLAVFYDNN